MTIILWAMFFYHCTPGLGAWLTHELGWMLGFTVHVLSILILTKGASPFWEWLEPKIIPGLAMMSLIALILIER